MRSAAILTVLLALVAGCAGAPASNGTATSAAAGSQARVAADGPPVVTGLNWTVGHVWTHDLSFGNGTRPLATIRSIAARAAPTGWTLATDVAAAAAVDQAFFLQDLGVMGAGGTLTDGPFSFPFYAFPLKDNATWTAPEKNVDPNTLQPVSHDLTMTAHWSKAEKKYLIEARAGSTLRARYDYDLKEHWFTKYEGYAGGSTVHLDLKGSETGWKGTAFTATGKTLYTSFQVAGGAPANPPAAAAATSFQMDAAMTHLVFLQFAFGVPGYGVTQLVAPDGTRYGTQGVYDQDGKAAPASDFSQAQNVVAAQAGTWQIQGSSGGVFAQGYGLYAWGATVTPLTV